MSYTEFLEELKSYSDENYKVFHRRLLKNDNINVLGVRIPVMRKLAKKYKSQVDELMAYPDEFYEVTFVKLQVAALLPYNFFVNYVDRCVSLIDNWATCDCFVPKCIATNKDEFMSYIYSYLYKGNEFYQRFALTTLLHFYVEEKYYNTILQLITEADTEEFYYVHMAAAWLLAELIIKFYGKTVEFLKASTEAYVKGLKVDKKKHNKAIQKACESYRLSVEQKTYLKGLKI